MDYAETAGIDAGAQSIIIDTRGFVMMMACAMASDSGSGGAGNRLYLDFIEALDGLVEHYGSQDKAGKAVYASKVTVNRWLRRHAIPSKLVQQAIIDRLAIIKMGEAVDRIHILTTRALQSDD